MRRGRTLIKHQSCTHICYNIGTAFHTKKNGAWRAENPVYHPQNTPSITHKRSSLLLLGSFIERRLLSAHVATGGSLALALSWPPYRLCLRCAQDTPAKWGVEKVSETGPTPIKPQKRGRVAQPFVNHSPIFLR